MAAPRSDSKIQNFFSPISASLTPPALYDGVRVKRVSAYMIDFLIVSSSLLFIWIIGIFFAGITFFILTPYMAVVATLLPIVYHTVLIGGRVSATLGMRIMGLKVLASDGTLPGYTRAALQTIIFYVTMMIIPFLVLLVSFCNSRARCLHDILAGTVTVNSLQIPNHPLQ